MGGEIDVSLFSSDIAALAPFSVDEAMMRENSASGHSYKVSYIQDKAAGIATKYTWEGRLYQADITTSPIEDQLFDAEKDWYTGWVHIFWTDETIGRVKTMKFSTYGGRFSPVEGVIPMDVVDDLNDFTLGGVSVNDYSSNWGMKPPSVAGQIWVGGVLVRTDGGHMQAYMHGPPWTFGRDVFVGLDGTEARTYNGKSVPVAGGKMLFVGSKVYYIGPGIAYEASGTDWTGDSSPTFDMDDIESFGISQGQNQPARLTMAIPFSTSDSVLREGSDIALYAQYSEEGGSIHEALVGTFNIDAILEGREEDAKFKNIIARSSAGKAITMWAPDTSYDYWGADTKVALPAGLTELIRTDGTIVESGGYLQANGLNDNVLSPSERWNKGHMYSLARPSRGGICKIRFRFSDDTLYDPQVGITLNMYRETLEEATARLDPDHVNQHGGTLPWWHYGVNCLAVVWGKREASGSPGISLKWIGDSDWTHQFTGEEISSHALALSADTDYWLMTIFNEGVLDVYYRLDSSTSWTLVTSQTLEEATGELLPWHRTDQKGRFGLYLYNETPWIDNNATIASDGQYLPFRLKTDQHGRNFPVPDTYLVDQEQFNVTAIAGSTAGMGTNSSVEGHVWNNVSQPYPNAYTGPWTGYEGFWTYYINSDSSKDAYDNMLAVNNDTGRQYIISDWDYDAPQQWSPTGSPWPVDWIDHVGDLSYGAWNTSQIVRVFFNEEPRNVRRNQEWRIQYAGTCTRGYNGTQITTHSKQSRLHLYTASRVKVDRFHAFTNEREWSMSDMMTEIARKAGVTNILPKYHIDPDDNLVRSSATWALENQMSDYGVRQANTVARARYTGSVSSGDEFGIQFGRVESGGSWSDGWAIMIDKANSYITLYDADTKAIIERLDDNSSHGGWHTFSVQKERVNVYESETLIASFKLPGEIDTQSWAGPAFRGLSVNYDWPELSSRVDNFIMDIGKKGNAILSQLIGQKRLFWQDDQYGNLRLYRDRVTVNSQGSAWEMVHQGTNVYNEADLATRVRVEGAEAWQAISEQAIQDHGNIFRLFNAEDAENAQDAAVEADYLLEETARRADRFTLVGAADARVEAGDEFWVSLPDGVKKIVCDEVTLSMNVTPTMANFDMIIQGHNAEIE
jgi:hypothetical protein